MQRLFGQWRVRGGSHGLNDCGDGYLCGQWGTVVFCYGVGSDGEGEGSIGVDVALEFQFNGDFRVADALDAEGCDRDAVNA